MGPGIAGDPMPSALSIARDHLDDTVIPQLGSIAKVREKHFADAMKLGLTQALSVTAITGRVIRIPGWPLLGRSGIDLALEPTPRRYTLVAELKWCHSGRDKVYEAIWDLFKMALALRRDDVQASYLVTATPDTMWAGAFCGDILDGGTFMPEELCSRTLPWGLEPRWLAWDDLLDGGYDRHPEVMPPVIETVPVASATITDGADAWSLKAVKVAVPGDLADVPFSGGWPHGRRPEGARRPRQVGRPST
jgi:hypothetical protein